MPSTTMGTWEWESIPQLDCSSLYSESAHASVSSDLNQQSSSTLLMNLAGWETGYAMNLARDFGPRLMSYMLGYGHEVWSAGGYYFWVSGHSWYFDECNDADTGQIPMVAPFLGTTFGGF